ncbi:MAG: TVP38/TMEM64 family protein [Gordonia sp. (in: high G+C Gram-positive bacteria)]|uniref:TVP38/TMEM64 family protein n=1 Tax=Gordonia sp. (in: high G+C Gram-positive bacteria) TaxID=84139 RepID=UPI0039E2FE34
MPLSHGSRPIEEPVDLSTGAVAPAPQRQRRRMFVRAGLAFAVFVAVLVAAYFVPLPSLGRVREWSDSMGPWFVFLFFVAYTVVTIFPIPRTTFTVTSGALFGPVVGFTGSMIASSLAAVIAYLLARRLGRARVEPYLGDKATFQAIERRLDRRGWLAVGSLRLIAACPFSVANYFSGVSSVRLLPYTVASVLGMVPGTASVVFLGDAVVGKSNPLMLLLSAALFGLGILGLLLDAKLPVDDGSAGQPVDSES